MSDPKAECQELLNAAIPFAEQMLVQHGQFYPYGAVMKPDGEVVHVGAHNGDELPEPEELLGFLRESLRQTARDGEVKATAIVYDVRVRVPANGDVSDAIAVALDHRNDYSIVVLLPYEIDDGELTFGETFAQEGDAAIFAPE